MKYPLKHYLRLSWILDYLKGRWRWYIKPELYQWKMFLLMHVPGRIGSFLRKKLMGLRACGKDVVIEDDFWVGANSLILAGVTLKRGTIVTAGAVVTKDSELFSVIAGVPARKIGQ